MGPAQLLLSSARNVPAMLVIVSGEQKVSGSRCDSEAAVAYRLGASTPRYFTRRTGSPRTDADHVVRSVEVSPTV